MPSRSAAIASGRRNAQRSGSAPNPCPTRIAGATVSKRSAPTLAFPVPPISHSTAAGITDIIRFDGQRTRAEVIATLGEVDLLAAPSVHARDGKREGIPVVLMEAMSCGLPVVASRLSGIPELVQDEADGLLVPPGDAAALAAAIGRVMDDPELRRRLGAAARVKVQRDFDLVTNARRVVSLIDRSTPQAVPEGRVAATPAANRSSVRPDEAATVNRP